MTEDGLPTLWLVFVEALGRLFRFKSRTFLGLLPVTALFKGQFVDDVTKVINVLLIEDERPPPPLKEENGVDMRDTGVVVVFGADKLNFSLPLQPFLKPADAIPCQLPEVKILLTIFRLYVW